MADYPYDPELPFVVACSDKAIARFRDKQDARDMVNEFVESENWLKLIDTTPAPKIPADAEFIHWVNGAWFSTAARDGDNWFYDGFHFSTEEILLEIGGAEVVVLKRA